LAVPIQLALGRPGPLLKPGTSQYSACCGIRLIPKTVFIWLSIWHSVHVMTARCRQPLDQSSQSAPICS